MPSGGIESHVLMFCEHISAAGVEIHLVVPNFAMNSTGRRSLEKSCGKLFLHKGRGNPASNILWLVKQGLRLSFKKYDALYTNAQGESVAFFASFIRLRKIWVHHHHTSGDAADRATWGKNYRKALMNADSVIACSQRNAGEMSVFLGRTIDVIPVFSKSIPALQQKVRTGGKLNFGYYGRLIKEKGIEVLCRLSNDAMVNNLVTINIWGGADTYDADWFSRFPLVKYHGSFSGAEELITVVNSLDAFLLLSTHPEGLPVSLLEVMSAGVPWIATDRGGISDIACDVKATILLPADADYTAMRNAVLALAENIKAGVVVKQAQQQLYAQRFSSNVITAKWRAKLMLN